MMTTRRLLFLGGTATLATAAFWRYGPVALAEQARQIEPFALTLTDAEWRARLSPEAYAVLRKAETELPNSSPLNAEKRAGRYLCGGCGTQVFTSAAKYDAKTGWPSFFEAIDSNVSEVTERRLFGPSIAVNCHTCGGHLGHVFADGPPPSGLRYCINGMALSFSPSANNQ